MAEQSRADLSNVDLRQADLHQSDAAPAMDYPEHERTYEGFVRLVEVGTPACINVLLTAGLWGMRASNLWGVAGLVLLTAAAVLGASNARLTWRPGVAVTLLLLAVMGMTGGGGPAAQ